MTNSQPGRRASVLGGGVLANLRAHVVLIGLLLLAWQLVYNQAGRDVLASPVGTWNALLENVPQWYPDLQSTVLALVVSVVITAVLGVAFGFLIGLSRFWTDVFRPILLAVYAVPKIAIYPVFLLVFKVGFTTLVLFAIFHGIIPIIILVMEGVRSVPSIQLKLGRVYNLSFRQKAWYLLLPAITPVVVEAVRVGASLTFLGLVVAEMFGSSSGLGNRLVAYLNLNQTDNILSVFILISVLGIALSMTLMRWQRAVQSRSGLLPNEKTHA